MEQMVSGVGVLDKSMMVLHAVAAAEQPCTLGALAATTNLPKATTHRLAQALEVHGLLRRDPSGRYLLGLRLVDLGRAANDDWPVIDVARPALESLRSVTGESVQLYVRDGGDRICVISLESSHELRTIVAEGVRLPLGVGSAGRILADDERDGQQARWVASVEERAPGVASVSAAVTVDGALVAAVGISGPVARFGTDPGTRFGAAVARCATAIEVALRR